MTECFRNTYSNELSTGGTSNELSAAEKTSHVFPLCLARSARLKLDNFCASDTCLSLSRTGNF